MKPLISTLVVCTFVCMLNSCIKYSIPIPPPPNNGSSGNPSGGSPSGNAADTVNFFANGDSAYVVGISVDTTRDVGFEWPQIIVKGTAIIPAKQDTLTFELQIYNGNNTYVSVNQFMGNFNDTSAAQHSSTLTLSSEVNFDAYQDSYNGNQVLQVNINANDGKVITGTMYGTLTTFINNNGTLPVMTLARGTIRIELP